MATFQEKYLKYKTKYLVLLNKSQPQNGGSNNIMNVSNLSDTPINSNNMNIIDSYETPSQNGGAKNIMKITNLSDTPIQHGDNDSFLNLSELSDTPVQDGGKKKLKKIDSEESISEDSNLTTQSSESSGGSSKKIGKYLVERNSSSSKTDSDSSDFSLSDSSESLLSVLEDSESDSNT